MSLIKILNKQKYKKPQPKGTSLRNSYTYGSYVSGETALEVSAFYRGLTYVSTQVAKMPWDIKKYDNTIVNEENDLYYLLNIAPNDEMTCFSWKALCVMQCFLKGNSFNEIVRDRTGKIVAIYPIVNHDVCIVRDANGDLFYQLSNTVENQIMYLRKEEVLHFKNLHTDDGINGLSIINYASKVLGIAQGADKMAGGIYANGGLPAGTLETDKVLNEEVITRLRDAWKDKFGGNKAGGVAVLEQGMKFNPVTFAPDVLQFLESRQFSVLEIARFLGVPPSKLYVLEAQSYNNIEHSNLEVSNDTIDVWAKNFEGEVNVKLIKKEDKLKSDMDLYAINRGDMKTRAEYFGKMLSNGAMSPNEIRRKEGASEYDGGDNYYISTNNLTPVSRHDEIIDNQINNDKTKTKENETNDNLKQALVDKIKKK